MTISDNLTIGESTREDIPLKKGIKSYKWYSCNDDKCFSGSKFINIAFGSLTVIITIALLIQIYYGDYQVIPHGSVATDSLECSQIGSEILKQGGNAVDAGIASTFCLTVVVPHLTSLDAEGQIMIYNHHNRQFPITIEFAASSRNNYSSGEIPTLVLGMAFIHQQFGNINWKNLIEPSIDLARKGYIVSKMLAQAVNRANAQHLFGRLEPGQLLQHELLANTLSTFANISAKEITAGSNIQIIQSPAIKSSFENFDVFVPSRLESSSIGRILLVNLREIDQFNFTRIDVNTTKKIIQTTMKTYDEFRVDDKFHEGTSTNVAVMDLNDNYVSLVSGMYKLFGSGDLTSYGYVSNLKVKEKPCSRIPLILTNNKFICGKRIVLGVNNIAQATQILANLIINNKTATEAIEAPRFYLTENYTVGIEDNHSPKFSTNLFKQLHNEPIIIAEPYLSSNIIEKFKDELNSHSDSRGGGISSRF